MRDFDPAAWQITVRGFRIRIDFYGYHYRTSDPFWPRRDGEGIRRPNRNAETLAGLFRFAARAYGHPDASDFNPDPAFQPQPEPVLSRKERRARP